jgi:hypothetical protein
VAWRMVVRSNLAEPLMGFFVWKRNGGTPRRAGWVHLTPGGSTEVIHDGPPPQRAAFSSEQAAREAVQFLGTVEEDQ